MSEWDGEGDVEPWSWEDPKTKAVTAVFCVCAVIAWMLFAQPGEEAPSSRGFNLGYAGNSGRAARPASEARPTTSLDMVSSAIGNGPPGVDPGIYRSGAPGAASLGGSPAAPAAPPAAAPPAAADAAAKSAGSDESELKAVGIPADAGSMSRLGAQKGLLSALAAKMLDHPGVLKALFNNKHVVDAVMNRALVKENCRSAGALKTYLSDPNSGGMTKVLPVIQAALGRPETAAALAGTELAKRVMACPSGAALSTDKSAMMSIMMSNSKALGVLTDPRAAAALASNPQAAGLLAGVQSSIGR